MYFLSVRGLGVFYDQPTAAEVDYRVRLLFCGSCATGGRRQENGNLMLTSKPLCSLISSPQAAEDTAGDAAFMPCARCRTMAGELFELPAEAPLAGCTKEMFTDALSYIAGYVAFKLIKKHHQL